MTLLLRPIWSKHLSHSCFIMFCTKSVWLSCVDYVKTQRWKLSKQQRAGGWQRGHSPTVDVKCICLCLTDCWCVCCSQQLLLFVVSLSWVLVFSQDVSIFLSLSLSNKKGRNHTRQELISQAANSHSRWSFFFFFFPSKVKRPNESSDLICDPRRNRAHEIVFSSGRSTLSLYFSAFILLYLLLLWSPHIYLSESARGAAAPPGQQQASGLIQFCMTGLFLRGSFHSSDLHSFFFIFLHVRHL